MSPTYAPVLAALHAAAFPHEPWDEASFATMLAQPGMHGFLDERGGFLLLRIIMDEAEIITIGVTATRQGIATALMQQGIAAACAAGVKTIHLEVAEDNIPARALYAAQSFNQTGRRKAYYANGTAALTLALDLRQH
jgi:[ribosomal protein S18]-alanine N-acetyltransferase